MERIEKVKRAMLSMQRYNWEQGVAAQAFLELGETEWAVLFAKEAVLRQTSDGRLAGIGNSNAATDPAANGEAVLLAAQATGDRALLAAAEKMGDWLRHKAPGNEEGILYHLINAKEFWIDSMYMAPPFLALLGYPEEAVRQIQGYRKYLWDPHKKLYSHRWDDEHKSFKRKAFWGVGNGWAAAGILRVVKALPEAMKKEKDMLIGYLVEGIQGCLAYEREDGLFHDVLDEPSTFIETNLSQMLSYSIYRSVAEGWLGEEYLKPADRMREAARRKVDAYGLVQGVCGAPGFNSPGTAVEGQAFFLLMEAAAREIRKVDAD